MLAVHALAQRRGALLPTTEPQIIPPLPFLRQVLQCLPIAAHHHQFTVASDRTMLVADDDRHSGRIGKPWREHWQLFGRFPRFYNGLILVWDRFGERSERIPYYRALARAYTQKGKGFF